MCSSDYRRIARENLAGSWGLSIGVAAIACLLGGVICGSNFLPELKFDLSEYTWSWEAFNGLTRLSLNFTSVLSLAQFILGGVFEMGHARFLLNQRDRRDTELNDLFSMLDYFGTGFWQACVRPMYIFLWSLLLIVPGSGAGYSYAMTPFILAEHPDMTASEAIRTSKAMMNGHKWELFCLDFSFIGWCLLCALTLNLGNIVLNPYRSAARAVFYRNLCPRSNYSA